MSLARTFGASHQGGGHRQYRHEPPAAHYTQNRPDGCRVCGEQSVETAVVVPANLSHTGEDREDIKPVDACLAGLVRELNEHGALTAGACCGHGKGPGEIILHDGTVVALRVAGSPSAGTERRAET